MDGLDWAHLDEDALREYQRDGQCYAGDTLEELHELIERDLVPVLVVEGHEQFNIVRYLGKYYGVAQSLGPVDLAQLDQRVLDGYQASGQCVVAHSLDEAKQRIRGRQP